MDHQISSELPPVKMPEQNEAPHDAFEAPAGTEHTEIQSAVRIERGQSAPANPLQQSSAASQLGKITAQPSVSPTVEPQSTTGSPLIADDVDLIEKEWVVKAKEIVMRTRHDPFQQNKQVEHLKADYLKKRYNKDIKVTED